MSHLIVIMGVSGCGKSTTGRELAKTTGWPFLEGDDFHPDHNIQKMSSGTPLTDDDRRDWVAAICDNIRQRSEPIVLLACSALTPFVRTGLKRTGREIIYIHLNTDGVDMTSRLTTRDHFMPADLLDSQYAALSVPDDAHDFDSSKPIEALIIDIIQCLNVKLNPTEPLPA